MKLSEFEQIAKDSQLRPLEKIRVRGVEVCLAEGSRGPDGEMRVPYWHVAYGIALGEDMDTCQRIKIPQWVRMPSGIEVRITKQDRIDIVMDAAKNWIDSNEQGKRYAHA